LRLGPAFDEYTLESLRDTPGIEGKLHGLDAKRAAIVIARLALTIHWGEHIKATFGIKAHELENIPDVCGPRVVVTLNRKGKRKRIVLPGLTSFSILLFHLPHWDGERQPEHRETA
jgi:hypothetical protein